MKVKTLISVVIAGLLATGIGYAAADDNVGSDSRNSTFTGTNGNVNDPGEMGGVDDKQNSTASGDTETADQPGDSPTPDNPPEEQY